MEFMHVYQALSISFHNSLQSKNISRYQASFANVIPIPSSSGNINFSGFYILVYTTASVLYIGYLPKSFLLAHDDRLSNATLMALLMVNGLIDGCEKFTRYQYYLIVSVCYNLSRSKSLRMVFTA